MQQSWAAQTLLVRLGAGAMFCAFCCVVSASADDLPDGVDPQTGYRMENYRAPTPSVLPGGRVADLAMVRMATEGRGHLLVDVYAKGAVPDPLSGEWSDMDKRQHIPGSIWLPGIGSGALDRQYEAYFRRNLEHFSKGDTTFGFIFYCMSDCWQSWNAAQRAIRWGYSNVAWYPLGTDGWTESGEKLTAVKPVNFLGTGT